MLAHSLSQLMHRQATAAPPRRVPGGTMRKNASSKVARSFPECGAQGVCSGPRAGPPLYAYSLGVYKALSHVLSHLSLTYEISKIDIIIT